jgi:hypothetical protein
MKKLTDWHNGDTPPPHSNPVLVVIDLARPQDEILRKTWPKSRIKMAWWQDGKWTQDGSYLQWSDVFKITHWRELPEITK